MTEIRIRQAVRALLVTPDRHILLVRFEFPTRTVWSLPGGGIDDDLMRWVSGEYQVHVVGWRKRRAR